VVVLESARGAGGVLAEQAGMTDGAERMGRTRSVA
jgi:hypothetical protein